jgi:hypothetical protein
MRWIRANLRFGAWCALLALTMQLALSFGHVHVSGKAGGTPALLTLLLAPTTAITSDDATKPAKPGKSGIAHDQCAVCSSMQLAGSLIPAAAPSVQLFVEASPLWRAFHIDLAPAASPHDSFQARAPPHA